MCVVTALVTVCSALLPLSPQCAVSCYSSSHSVKDTVTDNQEQSSVHFTNSVLCSWDYCISEEKTAKSRKSIIFQEFKVWQLCTAHSGYAFFGAILHHGLGHAHARPSSGWLWPSAPFTSAIWTRPESEVLHHYHSKHSIFLLYFQTTALCSRWRMT